MPMESKQNTVYVAVFIPSRKVLSDMFFEPKEAHRIARKAAIRGGWEPDDPRYAVMRIKPSKISKVIRTGNYVLSDLGEE